MILMHEISCYQWAHLEPLCSCFEIIFHHVPYKDHPLHKSSIDEETPRVVVEQDSSSDDEEERVRAEPNPDTYKPPVPYPQALSKPKAKVSEFDDHLLEVFQKIIITIRLVDAIKHIPSYAKFHKGICTPHKSPKRIQLSENIS